MSRAATALERVAIGVASLALSVLLIALLSGYFTSHDPAGVSGSASSSAAPPGQAFRNQGHRHLQPGQAHPAYDSAPPTSGAHIPAPITRDGRRLSDDQILQALEVGDVIVLFGGHEAPGALKHLTRQLAAPFSPALAAAGQAIVLGRRPGIHGLVALAWAHLLRVRTTSDPALRQFLSFWLGRGATSRCC